jgi:hypothetical protein
MKILTHCIVLVLLSLTIRADWREPLSDSAVGETATGVGWLVLRNTQEYSVVVRTDTGLKILPAVVPAKLDVQAVLGRPAQITAIVCQCRKGVNDPRTRFFDITEIKQLDTKPQVRLSPESYSTTASIVPPASSPTP